MECDACFKEKPGPFTPIWYDVGDDEYQADICADCWPTVEAALAGMLTPRIRVIDQ